MQKSVEQILTEDLWKAAERYGDLANKYVEKCDEILKLKAELDNYKMNVIRIPEAGSFTPEMIEKVKSCQFGCTFSRSMDQSYPRLCVRCNSPEAISKTPTDHLAKYIDNLNEFRFANKPENEKQFKSPSYFIPHSKCGCNQSGEHDYKRRFDLQGIIFECRNCEIKVSGELAGESQEITHLTKANPQSNCHIANCKVCER